MKLKHARWVGIIVVATLPLFSGFGQEPGSAPAPVPVTISPAANEVVKLAEAGTTEEVILGYIQNSQAPYNLSADDVVYLKDVGLSSPVITAMLNHDKATPGQPYTYNQQLYPPTAGQVPQPPPAPAPEPLPVTPPAPVAAPPPEYVSTAPPVQVNSFYNQLSPYGTWVDLEGYGWCWQPSVVVVNRSWRPYCDSGHWVYSDAGWFWASDYSWGWAPFHYGRWHQHPRNGWVWFPDTVWAPSWVVWRNTGDYCGWAPLPYGSEFDARLGFRFHGAAVRADFDFGLSVGLFTFVGFHDFTGRDLGRHRLPPAEVNRFYHQTTVINNYTVNNNHVVVNHGIPVERVSAATHTTIRTVQVHDLPAGANRPATRSGNGGAVYRHELAAPTRISTPVVAQKIDERHPVIQHTPARVETRTTTTPNPGFNAGRNVPQPHNQGTYTPGARQPVTSTPVLTPKETSHPDNVGRNVPQTPYTTPQSHNQGTYTPGAHQPPTSAPVLTPKEPSHPVVTTTPAPTTHSSPSRSTVQSAPLQTSTPTTQNPHVYYPKSYYQASSAHMLPAEPSGGSSSHTSAAPSPGSGGQQQIGGQHGQSGPGQLKQPQK